MAANGFFTVVIGILAIVVIGMVVHSLVRSWRRPYPARASGFAHLAGSDPIFHDKVAAPYLAVEPRYRLDNIYHKTGPGYHLYSYDVYPPSGRVHNTLAIVDDRLDLPRFSITSPQGEPTAGGLGQRVLAGLLAASAETVIAFPECPSLDAGYLVTGGSAADVRRVLHRPILDWLAALRHEPGMSLVAIWGEGSLLVWGWDEASFNSPDPTASLQSSLDRLVRLHELLTASAGTQG